MTHPTREEWMSFLYGEAAAETKSMLQTHLDVCPECRAQVETWRGASQHLDTWTLPKRRPARSSGLWIKFAAAAAVVALAVVASAHVRSLSREVADLRAELHREIANRDTAMAQVGDQAVRSASAEAQSLVADLAKALDEERVEDRRVVLATLQQMQTKQAQDHAVLRKELETVAVLTEAGLRYTHNEIANIAYAPESK